MTDPRDAVAAQFRLAADKLERAAAHCRIAADHYDNRNIPRGCAHAFAAQGDIRLAQDAIDTNARVHAGKARIGTDRAPG